MNEKNNNSDNDIEKRNEAENSVPQDAVDTAHPQNHKDLENLDEKLPYPKSVFFIVSNEFCERFSFYGLRTILSIYLKNQLGFTDNTSTVIYHLFIMICYFFPLLGAIVADSWLGKYKTILYLSIIYGIGNIVVSVAAVPNTLPPVLFTMLGLVLIALGTGGIKPCVSAFGGDQFKLPQQKDQLKTFFSVFYFFINCGSLLSTFLTPILREVRCFDQDSCFSLAFGVPALLMILSIVIYVGGKSFYKIKEPEGNVIVRVGACVWHAITTKSKKTYDHWLDKAQDKYEKGFIDDIKAALNVLVLYIPLPVFWALFDQQGSRWTFQATRMAGEIGSFKIRPDQLQVLNPFLILAFIPLFDYVLYPFFAKCNLLKRPLQRLTVGGMLAALAFGISAIVEIQLEPTYAVLPEAGEAQLRLFNALPDNIEIQITDLNENFKLNKMEMWETKKISVKGERELNIKYTKKGTTLNKKIKVYEEQATSYTFLQNGELFPIRDENVDKSTKGMPKVRVIYSSTDDFSDMSVNFYDVLENKDILLATISKKVPYFNYTTIPLADESYHLKLDDKIVAKNLEFKLGGVYNILVVKNGNQYESNLITITAPNSIHMLYLVPQYVIITIGEVMFSVTGLEFSYSQAPKSMKSLLQAFWLLSVAMGNLIVVIIAEAKLFKRQTYEFLLFGGLMFLVMVIFAIMAYRYKYVEVKDDDSEADDQNDKSENHKE